MRESVRWEVGGVYPQKHKNAEKSTKRQKKTQKKAEKDKIGRNVTPSCTRVQTNSSGTKSKAFSLALRVLLVVRRLVLIGEAATSAAPLWQRMNETMRRC